MNIYIKKESIEQALLKAIKNNELNIALIEKALPGIESVKHHKKVTKKLTDAIGENAYLYTDYAMRLRLFLPCEQRVYKEVKTKEVMADGSINENHSYSCPEYFENIEENIYFKTYEELIANCKARIEGLKSSLEQNKKDLLNIDKLITSAQELETKYKSVYSSMGYIFRNAISLK